MAIVGEIDALAKAGDHAGALKLAMEGATAHPGMSIYFARAIAAALQLDHAGMAETLARRYPVQAGSALNGYIWSLKVAMALVRARGFTAAISFWEDVAPAYMPWVVIMREQWTGPFEITAYAKQRLYDACRGKRYDAVERVLALPGELDPADVFALASTRPLSERGVADLITYSPHIGPDGAIGVRAMQALLRENHAEAARLFDTIADTPTAREPELRKARARLNRMHRPILIDEELRAEIDRCGIRSALLIVSRLHDFRGAQMVVADLAMVLADHGVAVTTACGGAEAAFLAEYPCYGEVVDLLRDTAPLTGKTFDLVIAHNAAATGMALFECGVAFRHLATLTLSHFAPAEIPAYDIAEIDAFLFYSVACRDAFPPPPGLETRRLVLRNAVPKAGTPDAPRRLGALRRIAFITNHDPSEIGDCRALLQEKGIESEQIGAGHLVLPVDAGLLQGFDAVVTIGHSVQKALSCGVPVFVYDRWGGPGWVDLDTVEELEKHAFSGRHTLPRRTGAALAEAIVSGWPEAVAAMPGLIEHARQRYVLEERLTTLFRSLDARREPRMLDPVRNHAARLFSHAQINSDSGLGIPFPIETTMEPRRGLQHLDVDVLAQPRVRSAQVAVLPKLRPILHAPISQSRIRLRIEFAEPQAMTAIILRTDNGQTFGSKALDGASPKKRLDEMVAAHIPGDVPVRALLRLADGQEIEIVRFAYRTGARVPTLEGT